MVSKNENEYEMDDDNEEYFEEDNNMNVELDPQIRKQALEEAENRLKLMAISEINRNFEILENNRNEINNLLTTCTDIFPSQTPSLYILFVAIHGLFTSKLATLKEAKDSTCQNADMILKNMREFKIDNTEKATYNLLGNYMNSDESVQLYPDFNYETVEPHGPIAIALFEWLDGNYTLLSLKHAN
ncbi:hypothetical protein DLAC_08361 [Tieghemostelium lacteum]|uniref:Uncharacterized protein n=1 Tax=Tieghemostelium lacteum TaxID=361077 RepID=A0A151ZBS9_TIELA|nr:hypothetical protein DLAC_08361 [Tieghemostelium lacteum]|eukprot:KYQ91400.1 hypothetical protein DLAC_08361 [Tieghemostelium lacteum]